MITTLIKEDLFVPPEPNIDDIVKWGKTIKKETDQTPPNRKIFNDIYRIWQDTIRTGKEENKSKGK